MDDVKLAALQDIRKCMRMEIDFNLSHTDLLLGHSVGICSHEIYSLVKRDKIIM